MPKQPLAFPNTAGKKHRHSGIAGVVLSIFCISLFAFVDIGAIPAGAATTSAAAAVNQSSASATKILVLTNSDAYQSFTVAPGSLIVVSLKSSLHWTKPTSSNPQVVHPIFGTAFPDGSAIASFVAVSPGTSTLSSSGVPAGCLSGQICPEFILLWNATINVS